MTSWGEATFGPPASPSELGTCEAALGAPLPAGLRILLQDSNGVRGEGGLPLVWDTTVIADRNLEMRTHPSFRGRYMPFGALLFFAESGNGDLFGFPLVDGHRSDVFVWDHESDSRTWVAPNLSTYLEWWMTGRLYV